MSLRKLTRQQYQLIKLSLFIQLGFSAVVLIYACSSLVINQFVTHNSDYNEAVAYNLITFILSLNFPSPISSFLIPLEEYKVKEYEVVVEDPQSLVTLKDLPRPEQHRERL